MEEITPSGKYIIRINYSPFYRLDYGTLHGYVILLQPKDIEIYLATLNAFQNTRTHSFGIDLIANDGYGCITYGYTDNRITRNYVDLVETVKSDDERHKIIKTDINLVRIKCKKIIEIIEMYERQFATQI